MPRAVKKSKWAIVREIMAKGLTSPTQISIEAKKIGYDISPGYISLLKTLGKAKIKREKEKLRKAKRKAARK